MINLTSHGEHKISIDNSIVYIESTGPWNIEYFNQLHLELKSLIPSIQKEAYTVCLSVFGDAVPVKEAIDIHIKHIKARNVLAIAVDISHCKTKVITQKVLSDMYCRACLEHKFFKDRDAAEIWLKEVLQRKID